MEKFGISYWVQTFDSLVWLPCSVIGLVLSLASLAVFYKIQQNTRIYKFFIIYSLNSSLVCLLNVSHFIGHNCEVSESYGMMFIEVYIIIPLLLVCYWFGTLLDILIVIDRIPIAFESLRYRIRRHSVFKQSVLLVAVSIIINLPYYMMYTVGEITITESNTTIWHMSLTEFGRTPASFLIGISISFVRDDIICLLQIYLNIVSMRQIKRQMIYKREALIVPTYSNYAKWCRVDLKTSLMVICVCYLSIGEHLIASICTAFNLITIFSSYSVWLVRLTYFSWSLKRVLDFVIFFVFNKVFRACVRQKLVLCQ